MSYELIRNAKVEVTRAVVHKGNNQHLHADIVINDTYEHRFPHTSRVSKHLELMHPEDLAERLSGGSYFIVDDQLVDFRDGAYNGFVHTDASIDVFMDLLGFQYKSELPFVHNRKGNDERDQIVLRKTWNENEIIVPGYRQGGEFKSRLSYEWNPFVKTIDSAFDLVRIICTNGMVGTTSFLNTKIPLFNRWEEHLDIAARQIQNKVTSTVLHRMQRMSTQRASIADCQLLEQHCYDRIHAGINKAEGERDRLFAIMDAVNPSIHLSDVYQPGIFANRVIGAQLPAHLSLFDVFNIATELRSHTAATPKSSDFALDKFANTALFDRDDDFLAAAGRYTTKSMSSFADVDRAYYGVMS